MNALEIFRSRPSESEDLEQSQKSEDKKHQKQIFKEINFALETHGQCSYAYVVYLRHL